MKFETSKEVEKHRLVEYEKPGSMPDTYTCIECKVTEIIINRP